MFPARLTGHNPYSWVRLKPAPGGGWEEADESGVGNAFDPQNRATLNAPVAWLVPGAKDDKGKVADYRVVSP